MTASQRTFLSFLLLLLLLPGVAAGKEIVAVMDAERSYYDQALDGFRQACLGDEKPAVGGVKAVRDLSLSRMVIDGQSDEAVAAHIRRHSPALILALGSRGLQVALAVADVPIVYLLAVKPEKLINGRHGVIGVEMRIPVRLHMEAMRKYMPGRKRLGVVYDPANSGALVKEALTLAPGYGIDLVVGEAATPQEVWRQFSAMAAKIDALWLVPDRTVLQPPLAKEIFLFALEHRIPVVAFADKYLDLGATMVISFDPERMGEQAGQMASAILAGARPAALVPPQADAVSVKLNARIIGKLGLTIVDVGGTGGGAKAR